MHHALLDRSGFCKLFTKYADLAIRIDDNLSDGVLLIKRWKFNLDVSECLTIDVDDSVTLTGSRFLTDYCWGVGKQSEVDRIEFAATKYHDVTSRDRRSGPDVRDAFPDLAASLAGASKQNVTGPKW